MHYPKRKSPMKKQVAEIVGMIIILKMMTNPPSKTKEINTAHWSSSDQTLA
jgi:hypothetical protein